MNDPSPDKPVAVITGAGSGIGRATAKLLAARGATVVAVGRLEDRLRSLAAETGCRWFACDLADPVTRSALVTFVRDEVGPVSILVNNAAVGSAGEGPIWDLEPQLWHRKFEVNLHAPFELTRLFTPDMTSQGWGRIVMVASTAGTTAWPAPAYAASKHALVGLARSVALHVGRFGVTCNAVCPGSVRTEMAEESARWMAAQRGITEQELWEERAAQYPARRVLEPEEVAQTIDFLTGPRSSGINGEAVTVALGGLR